MIKIVEVGPRDGLQNEKTILSIGNKLRLIKKIESLSTIGVSQWILSYFHTIRIFGNEAVHSKDFKNRIPEFVDDKDLEIGMYCMLKIIEFYLNHNRNTTANS
jgi:isopropylmalate/homocitrate/citramalate synthase